MQTMSFRILARLVIRSDLGLGCGPNDLFELEPLVATVNRRALFGVAEGFDGLIRDGSFDKSA